MRIALLSDVHANLVALEQVIADARQQGADEFWFLGDLLGYGPQPKECIFFLEDLPVAPDCWLSGNHDYAIALFVKLLPKLTFETPTIDRLGVNDPEAQLAVQLVLDQAGQRAAAIQAGELSPLFGARRRVRCARGPKERDWGRILRARTRAGERKAEGA